MFDYVYYVEFNISISGYVYWPHLVLPGEGTFFPIYVPLLDRARLLTVKEGLRPLPHDVITQLFKEADSFYEQEKAKYKWGGVLVKTDYISHYDQFRKEKKLEQALKERYGKDFILIDRSPRGTGLIETKFFIVGDSPDEMVKQLTSVFLKTVSYLNRLVAAAKPRYEKLERKLSGVGFSSIKSNKQKAKSKEETGLVFV